VIDVRLVRLNLLDLEGAGQDVLNRQHGVQMQRPVGVRVH
jgi:hypothetical protein